MRLPVLDPTNPEQAFPPLHKALTEPNGLLAIGGCLSSTRLINAYRQGIFPWYNPGDPLLWWSPNPRLVLFPDHLNVSRSLRKTLRRGHFSVTIDQAFSQVIKGCAEPRPDSAGTWITQEIHDAYLKLHSKGLAHSAEAWLDGRLVGGLYGVAIGQVVFGESMFHTETDASKVVFASLVGLLKQWNYQLVDCQVHTPHLQSLGAEEIDRARFLSLLNQYCPIAPNQDAWNAE